MPAPEPPPPSDAIPCVDLSSASGGGAVDDRLAATVDRAFSTTGFLTVTGHGVAEDLLRRMYDVTKAFFALPLEEKERYDIEGTDGYTGFAGIGRIARYGSSAPPNLNEQFHVNRYDSAADAAAAGLSPEAVASQVPNVWPTNPPAMEVVWRAYYAEMERLAGDLGRVFAVALDLPERFFDRFLVRHLSNLDGNWYPPQATEPLPGQVRNRTHVDFSLFTILYQDDTPGGLEVRDRSGTWHAMPSTPGTYVVNVGDVMNRLTNDRWKATFHRVVNPPEEARHRGRISIPYFVTPDHDAIVEPVPTCVGDGSRYEPITCGAYALQRRSGQREATTV